MNYIVEIKFYESNRYQFLKFQHIYLNMKTMIMTIFFNNVILKVYFLAYHPKKSMKHANLFCNCFHIKLQNFRLWLGLGLDLRLWFRLTLRPRLGQGSSQGLGLGQNIVRGLDEGQRLFRDLAKDWSWGKT